VRANLEKNKINWFLVKSDGLRAITKSSAKNRNYENDLKQEEIYVDVIKSKTDAFDSIMLTSYLLEIECLRQQKVYISEENTNQIGLGSANTLIDYYKEIENLINSNLKMNIETKIPLSLMWNTKSFSDIDFIKSKIKITNKMRSIYTSKIYIIQELRWYKVSQKS
jgi:hypothetical protein